MRQSLPLALSLLLMMGAVTDAQQTDVKQPEAQDDSDRPQPLPTVAERTAGMQRNEGFVSFYWDQATGKIWLEINQLETPFLYVTGLATGLGSNPVGLDRGQLGDSRVVTFRRVGPRVFLEQSNLRFRAESDNPHEKRAVEQSFASSILWSAEIVAESEERVLVDLTPLLLSDAHQVVRQLKRSNQREFRRDETRSAVYLPRCKSFPRNTEFEATLTFASDDPGPLVVETTPTPEAVTLRQHHSFIELPDEGYQPRVFDPRAASIPITFADYAKPIDEPLETRWILRHRLIKKDPQAEVSEPVEPIVYYVDPGVPEPVRTALVEGASWWAEAFEEAGFRNAYRVELLPDDADPLDVRYNVIMWVHRSTRGWSYGNSVVDPRTGEIIKGHVSLGSLRVRQDLLLMDGLQPPPTGPNACGCCAAGVLPVESFLASLSDEATTGVDVALARIRQLSAHEVGHTLGFTHNFAASVYGRASVMDYPAPLIQITQDGQLDLAKAYDVGVGAWDKFSVKYAYQQFAADADERAELQKLVQQAIDQQLLFLSDADARPAGAAHPLANLWDNGRHPVEELRHLMRVRAIALNRFSQANLRGQRPLSELQAILVPLYLHHRYQVDATAKMIGGVDYRFAVSGDGQVPQQWIGAAQQRDALRALLDCLEPRQLMLERELIARIPPPPYGYSDDRELFAKRTSMIFDPLAAAEVAADMVVVNLLQPERAARLIAFYQGDTAFGLTTVVDELVDATWNAPLSTVPAEAAVQRVVQRVVLQRLIELAEDSTAQNDVRAIATGKLIQLLDQIGQTRLDDDTWNGHYAVAAGEIRRFLDRPAPPSTLPTPLDPPPGSPIGQ